MCALALYLEDEGVPTTLIGLVREHVEAMSPPRALWVPFMLGRPLGAPDDPAFQRRVTLAALKLLERPSGPVIEDFPDDAPAIAEPDEADTGMACPISFGADPATMSLAERLREEVVQLQVWHDIARKSGVRSLVGVAGMGMGEVAAFIGAWAEGRGPDAEAPTYGETAADALRRACGDLTAFYFEAAAAQPGTHSDRSLETWFWSGTVAAEAMFAVFDVLKDSRDPALREFADSNLIPRAAWVLAGRGDPPLV